MVIAPDAETIWWMLLAASIGGVAMAILGLLPFGTARAALPNHGEGQIPDDRVDNAISLRTVVIDFLWGSFLAAGLTFAFTSTAEQRRPVLVVVSIIAAVRALLEWRASRPVVGVKPEKADPNKMPQWAFSACVAAGCLFMAWDI